MRSAAYVDANNDPIDTPEALAAEVQAQRYAERFSIPYEQGSAIVNDRQAYREKHPDKFTPPLHVSDFEVGKWRSENKLSLNSQEGQERLALENAQERADNAKAENAAARK